MELIYEKEYTLTDLHTDAFGRAKPSAILSFAQDIAGEHAAIISDNWEQLQQKHLFWAISRNKLEILCPAQVGETILLRTWPMATTKVAYPRAVEGYRKDGTLLFRMVSIWVLMDTEKRSLVLPGKSGIAIDGCNRGSELSIPSSLSPICGQNQVVRSVSYSELDRNLHMNNTRYMDWLADVLPLSFHKDYYLCNCTLCYLHELRAGESLSLQWNLGEDGLLSMDGILQDSTGEKRIFASQAQFKRNVL